MDDRHVVLEIAPAPAATRPRCLPATCSGCMSAAGLRLEGRVISASEGTMGGFKKSSRSAGRGAFAKLKFDPRAPGAAVPDTETQGRIHTSAATVAVLRRFEEVDVEIKNDDLRSRPCARRARRQHVNKTNPRSASPTFQRIVVSMQDSRPAKNRRRDEHPALSHYDAERQRIDAARSADRRGGRLRDVRGIRTYNFPQARHRSSYQPHAL